MPRSTLHCALGEYSIDQADARFLSREVEDLQSRVGDGTTSLSQPCRAVQATARKSRASWNSISSLALDILISAREPKTSPKQSIGQE